LKIAIQIRAWWSCKSSVLLVDYGISDWLYTTFLDRGTPKHPKLPTSEWLQNPVQKLIRCLNHVKHIHLGCSKSTWWSSCGLILG
jgi:hypothetical protein